VATVGTNTVTWNGAIPAGGTVTITINATIKAGVAIGTVIKNQATFAYDADGNSTNEASGVSDDPSGSGGADPTAFTVVAAPAPIPTLSQMGLVVLMLSLAGLALALLRRRRQA
jgi:hypothetical protein